MYKVNLKTIKNLRFLFMARAILAMFVLMLFIACYMKEYKMDFLIINFPIFIYGIYQLFKVIQINKKIRDVKYLCKHGKLIKNLEFQMVGGKTKWYTNNYKYYDDVIRSKCPVVNYTLSDGTVKTYYGIDRFDFQEYQNRKSIDLLIDEKNPDIYYLDFDIKEL